MGHFLVFHLLRMALQLTVGLCNLDWGCEYWWFLWIKPQSAVKGGSAEGKPPMSRARYGSVTQEHVFRSQRLTEHFRALTLDTVVSLSPKHKVCNMVFPVWGILANEVWALGGGDRQEAFLSGTICISPPLSNLPQQLNTLSITLEWTFVTLSLGFPYLSILCC